jgi:hypothetical protein
MLVSPQWHKGRDSVRLGASAYSENRANAVRRADLPSAFSCRSPLAGRSELPSERATNRVIDEQHDYGANDGNNHAVNV